MRYPGAQWKPLSINYRAGGCDPRFIILHIMVGTLAGTDSWFRNPAAQVSAHFGVGKSGTVYQWVDTNDTAWHAAAANDRAIGIEHEGQPGDSLTPAQIEADTKICAWAHKAHGIPLTIAVHPGDPGLAWHGLGQVAWGNHPDCPGQRIVAQRPAILAAAEVPAVVIVSLKCDGKLSLAQVAAEHGTGVSTVLRLTALHAEHSKFDAPTAAYIDAVFKGELPPAAPVPAGAMLWVPRP